MVALNEAIDTLLACINDALNVAERPVCHTYQVVGTPTWRPCCDCSDCADCSSIAVGELVAWVTNEYPVDQNLNAVTRVEACRRGAWGADIAIMLYRCYPSITEDVGLPPPEDLDAAARLFNEDADTVRRALNCCTGLRLSWRSLGAEIPPEGGCSYLTAHITVGLD